MQNQTTSQLTNQKVNFLLVDDRDENLLALEQLVRGERVEVLKAKSGSEALDLLLDHEVGLAFIDVQMPEMNGFELAELMRGAQNTKSIPIIFVTAGIRSRENTFRGYESGAVDFLYKPLDPFVVQSKAAIFAELYFQKKIMEMQMEEIHRAFDALKATEKELQRAVQSRDDFLAIASHELKTPLTPLKLEIQMLGVLGKGLPKADLSIDKVREVTDICNAQLNRVVSLVDTLLDVTRISQGKMTLNLEETNLSDLLFEVITQFSEALKAAGCTIATEIEPNITLTIDSLRMEQVLANIFQNILKYATQKPVEVKLKNENGRVRLSVRDHGPGIAPCDQDRIFMRFERAARDCKNVSGFGLGLYLAREMMEAHGGKIFLDSEVTDGSCFVLELPAAEENLVKAV